ncbi:MAG: DUF1501 domain-containing protein [Verrucomicrobia bacterium]|nr:DUF1501 domain-containing protein [Verrucomicrobiota bacterium]
MKPPLFPRGLSRRSFLAASTAGLTGLSFGRSAFGSAPVVPRKNPAKSTILFFLCGGASHIDMWDMKPDAPVEYRGEFMPIRTSAPELRICEHLPMTAKQAHHLALVHGVTDYGRATGDHHAGYYYNLTGHAPDDTFRQQGNDRRPYPTDWPHMGCVIGSRRPPHEKLPQVITLPFKPSRAPYTRPGQFAGRIGMEFDPFFVTGNREQPLSFIAPTLTLDASMTAARMKDRRSLLDAVNTARRELDHEAMVKNYVRQQEKAFALLSSTATAGAFDLAAEKPATIERYGKTINGMGLLMARRLVEAGVPFITVFWAEDDEVVAKKCLSGGGWDTHGNNFGCLKENLLPEFDRGFSALIEDLHQRSLLDSTLLLVTSEMGRKPQVGDPRTRGRGAAGRDHWTACMSVVMAGGGIRGGQSYGRTDAHAAYPAENPVGPEDITKTVYHSMGITNLEATDFQGRPYNLLEEGRPLLSLFG